MAKSKDPQLSHQTLKVLKVFLDRPQEQHAGPDILKQTGLFTGTVYPILLRLNGAGWLDSVWELIDPSEVGRPRKRLYRLTPLGYNKAHRALAELEVPKGSPSWQL